MNRDTIYKKMGLTPLADHTELNKKVNTLACGNKERIKVMTGIALFESGIIAAGILFGGGRASLKKKVHNLPEEDPVEDTDYREVVEPEEEQTSDESA